MANDWRTTLNEIIEARRDAAIAVRRHLHAHPEESGNEFATSLYLYQLHEDRGLRLRLGPEGRGLLVDNAGEGATKRIALRADIDALIIDDRKDVPYRSQNPGVMHACGHDAHSAIVSGALLSLDAMEKQGAMPWPVAWRAIFQPAEETANGAMDMIEAGAVEGVDAIIAGHVDPTRLVGRIGLRKDLMTANCDSMNVTVQGIGGHAARPHESIDPIAAAAQFISTVYQFVPRATDSLDSVVITIGTIRGGDNPNVIPEQVELRGTLRTLERAVRESTIHQLRQLARGIEEISGTRVSVLFERSIPSVRNDESLVRRLSAVFDGLFGKDRRDTIARPSMGSEDFACYLEHVPGVMYRLGCAREATAAPGLHTPLFDIDEAAIEVGMKLLAHTVVAYSKPTST